MKRKVARTTCALRRQKWCLIYLVVGTHGQLDYFYFLGKKGHRHGVFHWYAVLYCGRFLCLSPDKAVLSNGEMSCSLHVVQEFPRKCTHSTQLLSSKGERKKERRSLLLSVCICSGFSSSCVQERRKTPFLSLPPDALCSDRKRARLRSSLLRHTLRETRREGATSHAAVIINFFPISLLLLLLGPRSPLPLQEEGKEVKKGRTF